MSEAKKVNKSILIVDSDRVNQLQLKDFLSSYYETIITCQTAIDAMNICVRDIIDLIILDLNLKDKDGMSVIEYIRSFNNKIAIIVLSKRSTVEDKILALESGANDYMTKPYSNFELLSRMRKEFRYYSDEDDHVLTNGPLTIDYEGKNVFVNGKLIHLTNFEYKVLYLLATNLNKTMSYQEIIDYVWGKNGQDINALRVFVAGLRKKINQGKITKFLIQTCVGVGYRMNILD